jgi:ribosomal protein L7/L12
MVDTLIWASLGILVILAVMNQIKVQHLERTVADLRRRLDAVAAHLHLEPAVTVPPEVAGLIRAGRKIEAIKVYRTATGAGLAEAKEAVERMERETAAPPNRIIQP